MPSTAASRATRSTDKVQVLSRKLQHALAADRVPVAPGPADPVAAAEAARLRYVSDDEPGIRRVAAGKGFRYVKPNGKPVTDEATLKRIRSLAIPPAYTQVWICPDPEGHIQAVGRDDRGRKQYRYHARWREVRDRTKFGRMIAFARALPGIRRAVERDLNLPGLPRRKVLAALVQLLETTGIRVGNDEYARTNEHFGLTTLKDRHVVFRGPELRFRFTGKSGKSHEVGIRDRRLAKIVHDCQEVPGQRLFQYYDEDGTSHAIHSNDVNEYLHEIAGDEFTAKDFRTWVGTVTVASALMGCQEPPQTAKQTRQLVLAAIDGAAQRLGNTRSICRASYVHPAVITSFEEGHMHTRTVARPPRHPGLEPIEAATLRILEAAARPVRQPRRGAPPRAAA